ncbi:MAG: ribonuclease H-like domain-containing protein, partial [Clostridiales bacterium]|nr:ribonuclease H-like domain-containing protein [Clostridiales bacterium]
SYNYDYALEDLLFFDIETTGFSADTSYLYLIGCIYYENNSFHLIQWFSENIKEEEKVIASFFNFVKAYKVLLHYNGSGFDIPYIQKKCFLLKLPYSFDNVVSFDIYKKIYPYKKIFNLPNLKQKTIELFLKIYRKDNFSGGDLIEVYQSFIGKKGLENLKKLREKQLPSDKPSESELLLHALLLHNEDDIKGLVLISPILTYVDIFEKPFQITNASINDNTLRIEFEIVSSVSKPIIYKLDNIRLDVNDSHGTISIDIYEGELKHYYDNYKDYYYLPAEDKAIHKSVAAYVDKDFKEKAKPSSSYTRKNGTFVPQYEPIITPYFKQNYKDKITFLKVHTDFLLREEQLEQYVSHLLSNILKSK